MSDSVDSPREDPAEDEALDWDLEERDRWMDEHDDEEMPDPAIVTVEADE